MKASKTGKIVVYTDGGARNNPGPAAIGIVFAATNDKRQTIKEYSEYIGEATNNEAEYKAVLFALKKAKQLIGKSSAKKTEIEIRLDSDLVGKQLSGEYKILEKTLQPLFIEAWNLMRDFGRVCFNIIPREKNREADKLVNQELNNQPVKLY
jgi:ribonuclease HI